MAQQATATRHRPTRGDGRSLSSTQAALAAALALALFATAPLPVRAASGGAFDLSPFSVDGGGGAGSVGGNFALAGTIGQHDAGRHTGGAFMLDGGLRIGGITIPPPTATPTIAPTPVPPTTTPTPPPPTATPTPAPTAGPTPVSVPEKCTAKPTCAVSASHFALGSRHPRT